jgi:hypothetical protein
MYPEPPPVQPTPEDLGVLADLAEVFNSLGDSLHGSIVSRPMVGVPGSPYAADFAQDTLGERSLLSFGVPGALGLLQGIRGNARALALLYRNAGPPFIDPAPFELMRGIWEKSVLSAWLLDNGVSSAERLGRIKGWIASGLWHGASNLPTDTQADIQAMLEDCRTPEIRLPKWTALSKNFSVSGEALYRELSGLLHGRVWSVMPAFATAWDDAGLVIAWRGYPLPLHLELASAITAAATTAMESVSGYFADSREAG